jgi:hypothetical protein
MQLLLNTSLLSMWDNRGDNAPLLMKILVPGLLSSRPVASWGHHRNFGLSDLAGSLVAQFLAGALDVADDETRYW